MAPAGGPLPQSTIDLMLVYTPGMAQRYGDGLQTRLNNLVAIANQACIDSGVHITLRLVHTVQVGDYTATGGNLNGALNDLTYGNGVFAGASPTASWTVYNYRYYSATQMYLGVSAADSRVYYMGKDGQQFPV